MKQMVWTRIKSFDPTMWKQFSQMHIHGAKKGRYPPVVMELAKANEEEIKKLNQKKASEEKVQSKYDTLTKELT